MFRTEMETPAWRALSTTAQALYPWLKLEWRGPQNNNNGRIRLSTRQAAERLGVTLNTAAKAFHELQAKGFIRVTEMAQLGTGGEARSPAFELTEIGMPHATHNGGSRLYRAWNPGHDFKVEKGRANNPEGTRRKTESHHKFYDSAVLKIETYR